MTHPRKRHVLYPDFVARLTNLPLGELRALGVTCLAFDLDHTLAPGRTRLISSAYVEYLHGLKNAGFQLILASNALQNLETHAAKIGSLHVQATLVSRKPLRGYFRRLAEISGRPPREIAMIGDHLVMDIIGGNLAGLVTVKVDRLRR